MQRRRFLGFGTGAANLRGRLMFDITKEDLLREIDSGKIQAMDAARGRGSRALTEWIESFR